MLKIILYVFLITLGIVFLSLGYSKELRSAYIKYSHLLTDEDLKKANNQNIFVNFPNKSQQYKLNEIGIEVLRDKKIDIKEEKFGIFKENLEKELQYLSKNPNISLEKNEFYILGNDAKITLDTDKFLKDLSLENLLTKNEIRIVPHFKEDFSLTQNIEQNQILIDKMTKQSLIIKIGRRVFNLDSQTLKSFTSKYQDDQQKEIVRLDKLKIEEYLKTLAEKYKLPAEINESEAAQKLTTHLMFRLTEDVHTKTLVLPITSSHKMAADTHPKFIEVNKSNQRAYFFENGNLVKELVISTGVTWETPTGSFKVLNKVPMTISYSRIWYMPWYLPIGTINGPFYFGFHEVPYQVSYNGMIYSRDPETIGSPATGGCIQVLKGQAKEVYDWAEIGTPVYITEN
jgi:lipoprotein-anchoring transpeptidase ErfK/SrfK